MNRVMLLCTSVPFQVSARSFSADVSVTAHSISCEVLSLTPLRFYSMMDITASMHADAIAGLRRCFIDSVMFSPADANYSCRCWDHSTRIGGCFGVDSNGVLFAILDISFLDSDVVRESHVFHQPGLEGVI